MNLLFQLCNNLKIIIKKVLQKINKTIDTYSIFM